MTEVPVQVTLPYACYWLIAAATLLVAAGIIWNYAINPVVQAAKEAVEVFPLIRNLHDELRLGDGKSLRHAIETVQRELQPNGGSSMKDVVTKSAANIAELQKGHQSITEQLDKGEKRFQRIENAQDELLKRSDIRHVNVPVVEDKRRDNGSR